VLAVAGIAGWPWGGVLLWPAFSLLMISLGYRGMGPAIFRKSDGRLPLAARFWLAPFLLGTWHVQSWMLRGKEPHAELAPRVYLGRRLGRRDVARLDALGVSTVLDLTAEYDAPRWTRRMQYVNVPMLDLVAPTPNELERCIDHILKGREAGGVYIHCALGLGRSSLVAAAYLLAAGCAANVDEAIKSVRRIRPGMKLGPDMIQVLEQWNRSRVAAGA
jgi:predicted protein tyrosine phosphatase